MKFSLSKRIACLALAFALVVCGAATFAQQGASTIRGTVTDPTGAVVPGAKVKITNLATNQVREQTTSSAGTFNFELIPVGDYKVEIEAAGFKKKVITPLRALVGSIAEVKGQMEVGDISSVVTVEGTSTEVQINTQDATLGNNIVSKQILQLPMEARNVSALLTLQPGVTGTPDAVGYVAGARSDQSNITLDGVDINEAQTSALASGNGAQDRPVLRLNSEAIEEFRVTTVNANASQGRSSAAQVNLVTKSGKNQFFGSLFEYHRNTNWTSNDFFSNRAGVDRRKLIRNTFGGSVGGPIMKDKIFFFYSYEGRTDASEGSRTQVVPLPSLGQGQLRVTSCVPDCSTTGFTTQVVTLSTAQLNAAFPSVGINPAAVSLLGQAASNYPFNDFSQGDSSATQLMNTAAFRFNSSTPVDNNSNVAKIDWNITSKMTAYLRLNVIYDLQGQVPAYPDTPPPNLWEHPWGMVASHSWTLGSNWVNNFRYGFTRQAFSQQGDSADNAVSFRFIHVPRLFLREVARTTPVHNFVNDTSWIKGGHTVQFGTNIRVIRNRRNSFGNAYDTAVTNPSWYTAGGTVVSDALNTYMMANGLGELQSVSEAQNAATALIGRYSQYTARFTFDIDGTLLPPGTGTNRSFATEEYDLYFQDAWKITRNLTITYGLRYGISRPVYEQRGFEAKPTTSLGDFIDLRARFAEQGITYTQPIILDLSGPANGRSSWYHWDKNNFQPRVAVAWSPSFESSLLQKIFGSNGKSVLRGGFGITNDYYGQALAVAFDLNNQLGFVSSSNINANTYNITSNPAPLFGGLNDNVRSLPNLTIPTGVSFPRQQPSDFGARIESGLDERLVAPINYVMNVSYERELPWGMVFNTAYVGRLGRKLLSTRDAAALVNLRDPASGMDWYTAATQLEVIRQTRPPGNTAVTPIPYFENLFPANLASIMNTYYGGAFIPATFTPTQTFFWIARNFWANDWTDLQFDIENATGTSYWFQPQYGALSAWSTVANSNYHGMTLSVRQRVKGLLWDFNYTWSHSLDDASGLQTSGTFGGAFILNPFRQHDNYASSDFDLRHQININGVYELPFGRGKQFGASANRAVDAVIGGWQLSGIFRWNGGLPLFGPYDDARWATNWNAQSSGTRTRALPLNGCPTRGDATIAPKLFGCDPLFAYQSFRNAYPGETGERNTIRLPGYVNVDLGLSKTFTMPYNEKHKLQLRWEVFNVTNTQRFGTVDTSRTGFGLRADPLVRNLTPPSNWSNFTAIQGDVRVMQIGARFEF